ncbi:uncharacterized protein C1orf94 homolog [Opisthocomus hoazin]|uniref:uncharacterized protein C1orf94 homolog n=1 Tax=Opisthocomus hoazin TaxID=30419 RepID=UPI003F52D066
MFTAMKGFSALTLTSEDPFPLGPFPRHIWIHQNTPRDSLDEACHEIWKRVQQLSEELQPSLLVPPLQHALFSDLSGTLRRDGIDSQSNNYLLDEPGGLQSILYRELTGNRERQMKLIALYDAQRSAKSANTSFLRSAKSHKNSQGLEDSSTTGMHSTEGSKLEVPLLLKYTDAAEGAGSQVTAEETRVVKEVTQSSRFSSAKTSTAVSSTTTAAESQVPGQKQQLPLLAKAYSRTDSDAGTKNPETTATSDKKNVKYSASTSGFSTTSGTTVLNQPAWQSLSFPPFSIFLNDSSLLQFQVAPYSSQQVFPSSYTPTLNYVALVQPGYPYQYITLPTLSSNIQDLPPVAGDGIQHPFALSYGFSSRPGGAATTNLNYFSNESYVKF